MKKALIAGAVYALPMLVLAQTGGLKELGETVGKLLNLVIPILGAILLIYFFVGVWGYVNAGGDDEGRQKARNTMIYAIIGMFVAFSIFGLVKILQQTFTGGTGGTAQELPTIPGLPKF